MCLHVAREFAALRARVRAHFALVRFLARVRTQVHDQVAAVCEDLQNVLWFIDFMDS